MVPERILLVCGFLAAVFGGDWSFFFCLLLVLGLFVEVIVVYCGIV